MGMYMKGQDFYDPQRNQRACLFDYFLILFSIDSNRENLSFSCKQPRP